MSALEEDAEVHDLENIMDSLNKEIDEVSLCIADNLECGEEGGDGIGVEYINKPYCLDEGGNSHLTITTHRTKQTSSNAERKRKKIVESQSKKPKVLNVISGKGPSPDSTDGNVMVYIHNSQIKTESNQLTNSQGPSQSNEEIYEFDEIEELNLAPLQESSEDVALLKMYQQKNDDSSGGPKLHACPHCDFQSPKRYMLSRHMKSHSDERPYICSLCDRGFKTNNTLQNHINVHLGKKPHQCKSCESRFTTPGDLARHVRYKHTHDKRHKCTECDYATVELSKLRRHIRAHTGERPYQCPHCTYASPDTFKLKRHLRTHTGEKPYECDICQSRFTQSNSLKSHKLIHSVDDKPVFQCALCPTTCSRKSDLRIHVQKLHYSDKPFPCKRCGKELPDRYSYKMHVKTHEGERCYSCDQCHYKSISMRNLDIHKQVHSNEKPFACDICGQCFRQKQLLGRHMNIYHTENYVPSPKLEKIHSCPYCPRSFAHKGNMVRHMQVHDNTEGGSDQQLRVDIEKSNSIEIDLEDQYVSGDENINDENYEEYEVIEEVDEIDDIDGYMIVETIEPSTSKATTSLNSNMAKTKKAKSLVQIKKSSGEAQTKKKIVEDEDLLDDESGDPGYMVVKVLQSDDDLDDDDNCIILTNLKNKKSMDSTTNDEGKVDGDVANYFGFKTEEDNVSDSIEETELLDIIEEN